MQNGFDRTRRLVRIAAVAAAYFVCTAALAPVSFGPVQFRLSEVLILLCFYQKDYCYALVLGCALANLFSPMGLYDVVFGTLATALACAAVARCRRLLPATLFPTLFCVIIGLELYWLTGVSLWLTTLTVMLGEFAVVTLLGYPLFRALERNQAFLRLIGAEKQNPPPHANRR